MYYDKIIDKHTEDIHQENDNTQGTMQLIVDFHLKCCNV